LESREIGFTTTHYQVENQQLWLGTKRYITTSSAKKARKNRTYNYRYKGRGPKDSAGDKRIIAGYWEIHSFIPQGSTRNS
jgi:hypothetical protein